MEFLLILLAVVELLILSNSASSQYLVISCNDNIPYELNSQFHKNLESLLESVSTKALENKGFYNTSYGEGLDTVFGRALCRGDVNPEACKTCVVNASQAIMSSCRYQLAAIWLDECQIDYSYRELDSRYGGKYAFTNSENASDPQQFCSALSKLFSKLLETAPTSGIMFATRKLGFSNHETLYGLVQCTRDIDPKSCSSCLTGAFGDLNGCENSKGGAILSRTCNLRFELHPFFYEEHKSKHNEYVVVAVCLTVFIAAVAGFYALCKQRRTRGQGDEESSQSHVLQDDVAPISHVIKEATSIFTTQDLPFTEFSIVEAATDNFSDSNKLGQGGFGTVYKGVLGDGKEIAVKRLSRRSWQGSVEFMNEIRIIAQLQHRNLVRLLSCSLQGNEKLLIYEYVPNKSLDISLFDMEKRSLLDWNKRINIITGIARGLVYLHEESRIKIVHRDLKPSNVLLDLEMSAKISDFGLARIFCDDQNSGNTKRVVGTYGYMAPEYAMEGVFSVKSDVFSFGVVMLEIISGRRNSGFHLTQHGQTLLTYAWGLWEQGKEVELVDPMVREGCEIEIEEEVRRCIEIGLLCVQEDPAERPTMSQLVLLLETKQAPLPPPKKPAFSTGRVGRRTTATAVVESSSAAHYSMNQVTVSTLVPR